MKATMRRWVNAPKVEQMTMWMLRRLFKHFAKKYMGPYIRGELDLEQLDFQLCSGAGHLADVSLNTDTINKELIGYPIALKEGSVGRISVKLLPRFKIELDEVELRFVPQEAASKGESSSTPLERSSDAQHIEMESQHVDGNSAGGCSYLPVHEGVRVVANLFESLFFGMHVIVKRAFIAFEELPNSQLSQNSVHDSHCMLLLRIGYAEYNASRPSSDNDEMRGADVSAFTSAISFEHLNLELLDVRDDSSEGSSFVTGSGKVFGQPVSLLQEDDGLSGNIKLHVCSKSGCLDIPKVNADISLGHIKLQFTGQQIEELLRVASSYRGGDGGNVATLHDADTSHLIAASSNMKTHGDAQEGVASKSTMLSSDSKFSRSLLLPGAKLISDWVHWNDRDKDAKAVISEEDFAASTEEFFDCLSGSGLWMWTCSAFSAVSAASSFASGSVLISQEFPKQVTYAVKIKITGVSVMLIEGEDTSLLPASGSTDNGLSETVTSSFDYSRADCIQATFLHINLSVEVSQRHWEWQLMLKRIESCQISHQEQDVGLLCNPGEKIAGALCSSSQPLQALVEQVLPPFPISICGGMSTPKDSAMVKKCFLKLLDEGHQAGLQVTGKHKFCSPGIKKDGESHDLTDVDIHFQPLIFWFESSILCQLQRWVECFGGPADPNKSVPPTYTSNPSSCYPSIRKLHINLHFSCIRMLAGAPFSAQSRLVKDHLLCLDLLAPRERPMVKLRLSDVAHAMGEPHGISSVTLAIREGSLYLISALVVSGELGTLGFSAKKVLDISLGSSEVATMELSLRTTSGTGTWLAERTWAGVTEQQKGGPGGRKTYAEFAATTATEVMDENNRKIREDILSYSCTRVNVTIPQMRMELLAFQHNVVFDILTAVVESASLETRHKRSPPQNKYGYQMSVCLEVGEVEVVVYPMSLSEKKGNASWERYLVHVQNFQMLHVINLGLIKDVRYFWLRHGNGCLKGLLSTHTRCDEVELLTCGDNALGRGDGGGGNALATKSAGVEVSVISWPGGPHAEDMLITVSMGGCTFMAHGGRLDWLPGVITFFSQHPGKGSIGRAIHEKVLGLSVTETCMVVLEVHALEAKEEVMSVNNCVLFSLDLHDMALCYEPGKEALAAANVRARSMAQGQANSMEHFSPVSCCVAAAAVRVSSNAISNTSSKEYQIWLRDVALLLVDTTLRRNSAMDYTPLSLQQAGYVKVAGEAVMEAAVCLNGEDGLAWEVKCANNQLRVETCHDTTAALGRLIAQLQQLFVPEVEISAVEQKIGPDLCSCGGKIQSNSGSSSAIIPTNSGSSSSAPSNSGSSVVSLSELSLVNSTEGPGLEGNLEDAFTFVRGCSLHPDSCPCNCLDVEVKDEKFELLNKSDDDESLNSSLDHWSHDGADTEDLRTPVSLDDGVPSFIEDYYVTKKPSPSSSRNSSCKGGAASLQGSQCRSEMLNTVDGSGGWYDGHSFNVLEDHVPTVSPRSGTRKQRGTLLHTTNRRLGLEYPRSAGRVVFQDFNLRWRLYGGSDWLATKRRDSVGLQYATQISSGRQSGVCLEVLFHGVDLQHDTFPEREMYASRLAVTIRDVRVYDCSKDARWKKVLGYHRSKYRPRESSAKALKLELESVRPDPVAPLEEYRLSVHLLPLLLHLDQRHIDFLISFFSTPPSSSQQLQTGYEEVSLPYPAGMECPDSKVADRMEEVLLPFFQVCELQPFSIKVNYVPRRVDVAALRAGNYAELVNLVSWKGIELELKHVRATGVHGWGALSGIVVGEWLDDISSNQIHKFVKGLGPIRPLFAVGSGAAKLVMLPAEYYRRDRRRLLRGMRKGAIAFLRSISIETVGVGVGLAARGHKFLLQTESALGSLSLSSSFEKVEVRAQPGDVFEGLQQACENLSQGLERTASSLIGNPLKVYQRGAGTSTAVASAVRAAPAAAVAPVAAVAGALHCALLGVWNSLDPEHRRESEEKHSGPPPE